MKNISTIAILFMFSIIIFFYASVNAAFAQSSSETMSINGVILGISLRIKNNDICMPGYIFDRNGKKCIAAKTINLLLVHPCSPWDEVELPNYICDLIGNKQYVLADNKCFSTQKSAHSSPFSLLEKRVDDNYCLPPNAQVSPTPIPRQPLGPLNLNLRVFDTPTPFPTQPPVLPRSADRPFEVGISSNNPEPAEAVAANARWVRLNFINFEGKEQYYDQLIEKYTKRNIKILGLINHEIDDRAYNSSSYDAFLQRYTELGGKIISRYRDTIKAYELINEPNDRPRFKPILFATYMAAMYKKVKIDMGIRDVTILSGAVFGSNNGAGGDGVDYYTATYNNGIRNLTGDLNWKTIKAKTGSYPLDGIAYHIYNAGWTTDQNEIRNAYYEQLDNLNRMLQAFNDFPKPIYITEFGFNFEPIGVEGQAKNLETAFTLLKNYSFNGTKPVKVALWYTLRIEAGPEWGLISNTEVRPGYSKLQSVGKENL